MLKLNVSGETECARYLNSSLVSLSGTKGLSLSQSSHKCLKVMMLNKFYFILIVGDSLAC